MNKIVSLAITALGPILLAWALGLIKLPDSVYYLDYSRGGSELLNMSAELKEKVKLFVGKDEKEGLSIYNVHFINESYRNVDDLTVEFIIEGEIGTELISVLIKGPENYSEDLITKVSESNKKVVYKLRYINRSGDYERNYFSVNFLFSGKPPKNITPISKKLGFEFRLSNSNYQQEMVAIIFVVVLLFIYVWFFWWLIKRGNRKFKEKEGKYIDFLSLYLEDEYGVEKNKAIISAEEIRDLRGKAFSRESVVKKLLKSLVSEV